MLPHSQTLLTYETGKTSDCPLKKDCNTRTICTCFNGHVKALMLSEISPTLAPYFCDKISRGRPLIEKKVF